MRRGIGSFFGVLVFIALGVVIGTGLAAQSQFSYSQAVPTATAQPASPASSDALIQSLRTIYSKVNPSVVSIQVRIPTGNLPVTSDNGLLNPNQPYQLAAGSGFVYDTQGHIVTNAHVVQGTDLVEVTFSDGVIMRAKITGIDLDSDLAVIQVQGDASHYAPVALGDSDALNVGDLAAAIGNPFQEAGTMTHGIISALHRVVQGLHTNSTGSYSIPDAIQTDAPLNPGNSGGPLLNESGQVVGVNEQIEAPAGQSSGVSFAIPVNIVRQVVPALIKNGSVSHSYVGIGTASLDLDLNDMLHLPESTRGALVLNVASGSPAESAGLQAAQVSGNASSISGGDVIIAIDKQPIRSSDDLIAYLFTKTTVGQTVTFTILRNGKQQDIPIKLIARPR